MSILIRNGKVVTAAESYIADVYIEGEQIVAIGKSLDFKADKIIDATDKLVFPGGIDPHVHLDMPFMGTYSSDDYETGTRAASGPIGWGVFALAFTMKAVAVASIVNSFKLHLCKQSL